MTSHKLTIERIGNEILYRKQTWLHSIENHYEFWRGHGDDVEMKGDGKWCTNNRSIDIMDVSNKVTIKYPGQINYPGRIKKIGNN